MLTMQPGVKPTERRENRELSISPYVRNVLAYVRIRGKRERQYLCRDAQNLGQQTSLAHLNYVFNKLGDPDVEVLANVVHRPKIKQVGIANKHC